MGTVGDPGASHQWPRSRWRAWLSGRSRRNPYGWVKSRPMEAMTIRGFIDRRKDRIKIVAVPLLLAGIGMLGYNGKYSPWTSLSYIGLGTGLLGGVVYLAYIGTTRCPRCRGFIGLNTVSPFRNKPPQPERCVHCGLSFDEPLDKNTG
jgi:hypothetical protein